MSFFFKYRRKVYQIWKGMLIDYPPTYSVVVTVTMQRNNAIVIAILRRDSSRATSCYCDRDTEEGWFKSNFNSDKLKSIFQIV